MAGPIAVAKAIAGALGISEGGLIKRDYYLGEAGVRRMNGAGAGATEITSHDAAATLIAGAVGPKQTEVVEVTSSYAALPNRHAEPWRLEAFPLPRLIELPPEHSLRDALAALIESAREGSLLESVEALPPQTVGGHAIPALWDVEVTIAGPWPHAWIRITAGGASETHSYSGMPLDSSEVREWSEQMAGKYGLAGLRWHKSFSAPVIEEVGATLRSGFVPYRPGRVA